MRANHALQRTRHGVGGLQSLRPVGRVAELGSLGIVARYAICPAYFCFGVVRRLRQSSARA